MNHTFISAFSSPQKSSLIAGATKIATKVLYYYYVYDPIALSLMQVATWSPPSVERGGVRAEAVSARAARAIEFARHGWGDEGLFGGAGGSRGKSRAGLEHAARWLAGHTPEVFAQ